MVSGNNIREGCTAKSIHRGEVGRGSKWFSKEVAAWKGESMETFRVCFRTPSNSWKMNFEARSGKWLVICASTRISSTSRWLWILRSLRTGMVFTADVTEIPHCGGWLERTFITSVKRAGFRSFKSVPVFPSWLKRNYSKELQMSFYHFLYSFKRVSTSWNCFELRGGRRHALISMLCLSFLF